MTILRNGWYTENYTSSIPGALAGDALLGSAGEGRISWASRADYAEAAVAVLTGAGHEGETWQEWQVSWLFSGIGCVILLVNGASLSLEATVMWHNVREALRLNALEAGDASPIRGQDWLLHRSR